MADTHRLADLDKAHVWHPFTPMKQWAEGTPLVIDSGDGFHLIDTEGKRYIDGTSSLWCNVHGHRVPAIDLAIREQLDKIAHSTLLGLASTPSIELAARLVGIMPAFDGKKLDKVFYSDAGATALEAAFKMAVGYWHHTGRPEKCRFIAFEGAYHGDTTGAMSVGYSDYFHRPFAPMCFPTIFAPAPDAVRVVPTQAEGFSPGSNAKTSASSKPGANACFPYDAGSPFPSQNPRLADALLTHCLAKLDALLRTHAETTAAIVLEPIMQGAAGMICQPPGFVRGVADLAKKHDVLLIIDEVAVGFGRTGAMFACDHERVTPDLLCLGKGITGGYLPLAATMGTQAIFDAFCGEPAQAKTFFHGHTYAGNALGCAAALASLALMDEPMMRHINASAAIMNDRLAVLRDEKKFPHVIDVRQRGIIVGIELAKDRKTRTPFPAGNRTGGVLCRGAREHGLIIRPIADTVVLMPIPAMPHELLHRMLDVTIDALGRANF
jgi:adenosylmethionine-8-amino-7-oxononanoate aminotransferase